METCSKTGNLGFNNIDAIDQSLVSHIPRGCVVLDSYIILLLELY